MGLPARCAMSRREVPVSLALHASLRLLQLHTAFSWLLGRAQIDAWHALTAATAQHHDQLNAGLHHRNHGVVWALRE